MKRLLAVLLLLLTSTAHAQWGNPERVGDCYAPYHVERDALRRVAIVRGVPQTWVDATVIYCDPWTPYRGFTWQRLGQLTVGCSDRRYWNWWIGCMRGTVSSRIQRIAILRMHPYVWDTVINAAQLAGASSGTRTWPEIRCMDTLRSLISLAIHEYHHLLGYHHENASAAAIMAAADRAVMQEYMRRYGSWVRANEWSQC